MTMKMVTTFLMEECVANPLSYITSFALYHEFDRWCRAKAIPYYIQTPTALTRALHELGIKTRKNKYTTIVVGISMQQRYQGIITTNQNRPLDPISALNLMNTSPEHIGILQIVTTGRIFN